MQTIQSYVKDRELVYQSEAVDHTIKVTSAARLYTGTRTLEQLCYDKIFNIEMTYLVGYADDVARVIAGRNIATL